MLLIRVIFEIWIFQFTFNQRCPNIYGVHFWRKTGNCTRNGRSRGWTVMVLAVLGSRAASTRTAQPLDLPFLVWFPFFLHNCTPYMLGHLPLSVNYKLKNCHHSTIYWMFEIIVLLKISFWSESFFKKLHNRC